MGPPTAGGGRRQAWAEPSARPCARERACSPDGSRSAVSHAVRVRAGGAPSAPRPPPAPTGRRRNRTGYRQGLHRARRNHHAVRPEGARREGRALVVGAVGDIGEGTHLGDGRRSGWSPARSWSEPSRLYRRPGPPGGQAPAGATPVSRPPRSATGSASRMPWSSPSSSGSEPARPRPPSATARAGEPAVTRHRCPASGPWGAADTCTVICAGAAGQPGRVRQPGRAGQPGSRAAGQPGSKATKSAKPRCGRAPPPRPATRRPVW